MDKHALCKRHCQHAIDSVEPQDDCIKRCVYLRPQTNVKESSIEDYFIEQAEMYGALAKKIMANMIGWSKWPDRALYWPVNKTGHGIVDYVELKKPKGGRFESGQEQKHEELRKRGFYVTVAYTKEDVDAYFNERAAILGVAKRHAIPKGKRKVQNINDFLKGLK